MSIETSSMSTRPRRRNGRRGAGRVARSAAFSLVELLVTVGIIGLLVAILLPSLGRARANARSVKCLSNERQLGIALRMYAEDNHGSYPVHNNWASCFGKRGWSNFVDHPQFTGFAGESDIFDERPVNRYLQSAEVCQCPADNGDPAFPYGDMPNCYEGYGTSYLVVFQVNCFGVQHVTDRPVRDARPLQVGDPGDMTTKIVLGDWTWVANRPLRFGRTQWHPASDPRRRTMNMLFADGHAQALTFPEEYESQATYESFEWEPTNPDVGVRPDPTRGYW